MLGLVVGFIPFVIFAIWIKLDSNGKIIFKQKRVGRDYKIFEVYKLRTMRNRSYDENGRKIPSIERITRPGRIARSLSIDELPQLYNVLKGEMSIIGPRPLIINYFPYFTDEELRRHDVKPGVTGLAQVKGRAFIDWDKRFKYDVFYVDHITPWLDIKILFETIISVLKREGTALKKPKPIGNFNAVRKTRRNNAKLLNKDGTEFKYRDLSKTYKTLNIRSKNMMKIKK